MSQERHALHRHSEAEKARRAPALAWSARLAVPHHLVWMGAGSESLAARVALPALFAAEQFPTECTEGEILWRRDLLGKPYVTWQGSVADWAERRGRRAQRLHVSNAHDGSAHLVLAAYAESLVGLGVDVVHLPRLRRPGKEGDYLRRFARQFMAEDEWEAFASSAAQDDTEALRVRVAAHFSFMEALSKACGTGLKLGMGLGRAASLPRCALGIANLASPVSFLFGPEAHRRLETLGATNWEGHWGTDGEYLVSVALLRR
jgi:phosphopantetheinyl transferase (holo-ACP synthase)